MDKLVVPEVKEVDLIFVSGQKCFASFKLTNLMHTMSVAVSLINTNPSLFSLSQPFSIIRPLSSSSYTLFLSQPSDQLPLSAPPDVITVRTSMLPTGKANLDDLRRLFSKPGPHVFRDAVIPISFVGPQAAEYLISNHTQIPEIDSFFRKAISKCNGSQLTSLLKPAIVCGNASFVKALIDAGGDVNWKDPEDRSLMPLAVRAGSIDVVKLLIDSGCRINNSVDFVFHDAAAANRVDLMEVLSAGYGNPDVNLADYEGRTPIHVAALRGHVKPIEYCLSIGGNPDLVDTKGRTPIHCAASKGHLTAIKCLLDCSNGKYAVDKEGMTAFAVAVEKGHSHLLDSLQLGDVLSRAARVDDVNGIKGCLAEGASVNGRDQNGWTPLHRAAFKGRIESVRVLLDHGAQVEAVDNDGYTPLLCAVEAGHVQVALLLIAHGAKANLKSLKGFETLELDSFKKQFALVSFVQ